MEGWARDFEQLDTRAHFNITNEAAPATEMQWSNRNETRSLISRLQLAQVQAVRTTNLTLEAFSLAVLLLTIHRIISDARKAANDQRRQYRKRSCFLRDVHPAETFPLVLACGAALQQILFVSVQSTSLRSVLSRNCRTIAMITVPAIFIFGYITLVFGLETVLRAYKRERLAPRGKRNTPICLGIVTLLTVMTWTPTIIWPMHSRCFGSLIWFGFRYDLLMIIIVGVLVVSFLVLAALISIQLMRSANIDLNERIAASRMCYYLLLATVVYVAVLPVQIQIRHRDMMRSLDASRAAEISLSTSGLIVSFLHLFLRVNANRMVIKSVADSEPASPQKRPKIRFFGPSDLEMIISGPLSLQRPRPESSEQLLGLDLEKDPSLLEASPARVDPTTWPLPPAPIQATPATPKEKGSAPERFSKSRYSVFPTRAQEIPRLPATVYAPPKPAGETRFSKLALRRHARRSSMPDTLCSTDSVIKPKPLFTGYHTRNDSTDSSATVQIGLRFSLASASLAAAERSMSEGILSPSLRREMRDSGAGINSSISIRSPTRPLSRLVPRLAPLTFSPMPQQRQEKVSSPTSIFSPKKSDPAKDYSAYLQEQREKILLLTPALSPISPMTALPISEPALLEPFSGLRMNPPTAPPSEAGSESSRSMRSVPSPNARIPLGAGTMARSPPPNGWI